MAEKSKKINLKNREIVTMEKISFSHDDFVSYYNDGYELENFIGGLEVTAATLREEVPKTFSNSEVVEISEDGKETVRQKLWSEYCVSHKSLDGKSALLKVGATDLNGNRKTGVSHEELVQWIENFTIDKILTKSAYIDLKNSSKYSEELESEE